MLRHRVKVKESDRFIAARSTEREMMIDRYKVKDKDEKLMSLESLEAPSLCKSAEPKTRTPLIIRDKKQISDKLYLSLLKTQLLKRKTGDENKCTSRGNNLSSKKRKRVFETNNQLSSSQSCSQRKESNNIYRIKNNNENEDGNLIIETNESLGNDTSIITPTLLNTNGQNYIFNSSVKLIRKLNFNFHSCKSDSKMSQKKQKLDMDNMEFNDGNQFKNSFKDLVNFDLSKEDSFSYKIFNQKNISTSPYKILDAPHLRDDFYLHLVDWSKKDIVAVGLENSVYLWESTSGSVGLVKSYEQEKVTSVGWMPDGDILLIGLNSGKINIWDICNNKCIHTYDNHTDRVGIFAPIPNSPTNFSSGSLDHSIHNYDLRTKELTGKFIGHKQEVCGLQWSHDGKMLASGGNDNKLLLWTLRKSTPEKIFKSHQSAIKAISWSYHKFGLLASGGGTQDRTIKLWNTNTMSLTDSIDTLSQVCNISFSKNTNEFVTTHGYSDNLILVWDYEKLEVIATLKGHRDRVIYMSNSPDGTKIVTGAGDETIRFWDVFKHEYKNPNDTQILNKFKIR